MDSPRYPAGERQTRTGSFSYIIPVESFISCSYLKSLLTQTKSSLWIQPRLWLLLILSTRDWRMLEKGVTPIPVATRTACWQVKTEEEGPV